MNVDKQNSGLLITNFMKLLLFFGGLVVSFIMVKVFITSFSVSDESMLPGLKPGDRIYVYKWGSFGPGDVILVKSPVEPGRVIVKRIIAGEGDSVEIRNKILYVNDRKMDFRWPVRSGDGRIFPMSFSFRDNYPIIKLKRKEYFLLGDYLDYSLDSRFFGPVSADKIIGRVVYKL